MGLPVSATTTPTQPLRWQRRDRSLQRQQRHVVSGEATGPGFTLSTTTGDSVELDDVLADGPALAYFSMGVGCDGGFALISADGTIERTEHYTTMFVPLEQLLDDFDIR